MRRSLRLALAAPVGRASLAELTSGARGAVESNLVGAIVVGINQVPLPPCGSTVGDPLALDADQFGHSPYSRRADRSSLVAEEDKADKAERRTGASDYCPRG